ncbi:hypothetical protein L1S32_09005 [Methanogenium sp. S4BF]|uniref:hypothetical protein n=1 Tax=Methanogenium sp. S4BF TaxID=1789226 RepID=UPI002415B11A|nr:hypothetical protein [Methanogenium sp. S4BF]WFN33980.1 hypothetical protein L1S32_09005 [Methanogenium sp. S4BF]
MQELQIEWNGRTVTVDGKIPTDTDRFVESLADEIWNYSGYTITSGYAASLFGHTGPCEEVEFTLPLICLDRFYSMIEGLFEAGFSVMSPGDGLAWYRLFRSGAGVRIARNEEFFPNVHIRANPLQSDQYAYLKRLKIMVNGKRFFAAPLELLIPFILMPGDRGTPEQAAYLYTTCKEEINEIDLRNWMDHLGVDQKLLPV